MPSPPNSPPSPFTEDQWRSVIDAGYAFLAEVAAKLSTTTYTAFCAAVDAKTPGSHSLDPRSLALKAALGVIADRSLATKKVILPAVILTSEGTPGGGFFAYAKDLGLLPKKAKDDERFAFWAEHIKAVYRAYAP